MANEKEPEKKQAKKEAAAEMSLEDIELQANLALMCTRASDVDEGVQRLALEGLRREIRTATSSLTSVPKVRALPPEQSPSRARPAAPRSRFPTTSPSSSCAPSTTR